MGQIDSFYPEIASSKKRSEQYVAFFKEIMERTAYLVACWQSVGFCHGVLNTDNMSIVGLTLDYGPFGFLEKFNPGHVCNMSDDSGRYAYDQQPEICKWNLMKLGEALSPLLPAEAADKILQGYQESFRREFEKKLR